MPLYSAEIESLKKDLLDLRRFNSFYGYEGDELSLPEYIQQPYVLSNKVKKYLKYFDNEQLKDINSLVRTLDVSLDQVMDSSDLEDENNSMIPSDQTEDNYFNAPDLELLFDRVNFLTYHDLELSAKLIVDEEIPDIVKELDKIFSFELNRIKSYKSNISNVVLAQKLTKVQEKINSNKINEASVLMSRFYNDNKQDVILGYLYFEVLFAKAGLGNQKSLAKAREVANNVCFLTDKSDESLISYYRYIYVCREFNYDTVRAQQLFREFVLIEPERLTSPASLTLRNGFYLKCLILFLRFDIEDWNIYEIETMQAFALKSLSGGVFYISCMRKHLLSHLDSVRFGSFMTLESHLYNIKQSHAKLIRTIQASFDRTGMPKNTSKTISTVGQKYMQKFFTAVKLPSFSDYLVNTSVLGVQYFSDSQNDRYLSSIGISEHCLWRAWVSKITSETSLQRADLIPMEQVLRETNLLMRYESLINRAYDYELEIYNREEYKEAKDLLTEVTQTGILKVILGENRYSVFDYGAPWAALKDYFSNLKIANGGANCQLITELMLYKGKKGLFWNLEEIQMMLESINLIIDNKNIGLKARLENILDMKDEQAVDDQYMTLSEHLEMYWWMYILLISMLIFFFNMIT